LHPGELLDVIINIPRLLPSIGIPSADEIKQQHIIFFDLSAKPQPTSAQNGFLPGNICYG